MKRRKWTSEAKASIVLSGLKGLSVAEICTSHNISALAILPVARPDFTNAGKAFDTTKITQKQKLA